MVDDVDVDLVGGKAFQSLGKGFDRAVHIAFDDDVEFLEIADGNPAADLVQGNVFGSPHGLFAFELHATGGDLFGLLLVVHHDKLVTGLRRPVNPSTNTGCEGRARSTLLSRSSNMARTLPLYCPERA